MQTNISSRTTHIEKYSRHAQVVLAVISFIKKNLHTIHNNLHYNTMLIKIIQQLHIIRIGNKQGNNILIRNQSKTSAFSRKNQLLHKVYSHVYLTLSENWFTKDTYTDQHTIHVQHNYPHKRKIKSRHRHTQHLTTTIH